MKKTIEFNRTEDFDTVVETLKNALGRNPSVSMIGNTVYVHDIDESEEESVKTSFDSEERPKKIRTRKSKSE